MKTAAALASVILAGATASLSQAAPLEDVGNGLFREAYADFGEWRVWRYTSDAAGKSFSHCMAMVGFDGERLIEVRADGKAVTFGFLGGYGFATVEKETKVSMKVEGKKPMIVEITVKPQLADYGVTLNAIVPGTADLTDIFMNDDALEFTTSGDQLVEFGLEGSHKAMTALMKCAGERW